MVLAPKTEHGMKARFKCKDGFKLTGPAGQEVVDENEYVLTCAFGNWTGTTPACQELFCAFPGYVDHGKILLIGNMGLYDYRPYVKKVDFFVLRNYLSSESITYFVFLFQIMNNKQIMYDCDKGYILAEKGPVGATCVGGLWRPTELPKCMPGLHPRLRWTRRKRNAKHHRLLRNFNQFKRQMNEILRRNAVIEDPFPFQKLRNKRSLIHKRGQRRMHRRPIRTQSVNHKWHLLAPAIIRFRRNAGQKRFPELDYQFARTLRNDFLQQRQQQQQQQRSNFEEQQQRAYRKYYEKIKQKHRNYINNLLRASHSSSILDDEPSIIGTNQNANRNDENDDDDGYKTPAKDPFDEINAYASIPIPIPLPNINENRNVYTKKEIYDGIVNNTFVGRKQEQHLDEMSNRNQFQREHSNDFLEFAPKHPGRNATNILDLLRAQVIRRRKRIQSPKHQQLAPHGKHTSKYTNEKMHRIKRSAPKSDVSLTSLPQHDEETRDGDGDNGKKARPKEPCEVSFDDAVLRFNIGFWNRF